MKRTRLCRWCRVKPLTRQQKFYCSRGCSAAAKVAAHTRPCACGCGKPVTGRMTLRFASLRCWSQKTDERSKVSITASHTRRARVIAESGKRFATKADAFAAGDRLGYSRAMRWWKKRMQKQTEYYRSLRLDFGRFAA